MDETNPQWGISDSFWSLIEPIIPKKVRDGGKVYQRKEWSGRPPMPYRKVFGGIISVLRTGCQWKDLPKNPFGNPSSINKYFNEWMKAGFFENIWNAGLAEHREMEGIAWRWCCSDESNTAASEQEEKRRSNRNILVAEYGVQQLPCVIVVNEDKDRYQLSR